MPLIGYCLETTRSVAGIDRVIVSTEDAEIRDVARSFGAEVIDRPLELAEDTVPTLPVLQHTLFVLKTRDGYVPDYVLLLYATSPLLRAYRIHEAIQLALAHDADSVVSGTLTRGHYWIEEAGAYRRLYPLSVANRQMTAPLFKENGALYLSKTAVLEKAITAPVVVPLIMEEDETIDIDTPADFARVEARLQS